MPVTAEHKAMPARLPPFGDLAVGSDRAVGLSGAFDHHANTNEPTVTSVAPAKREQPNR